MKRDRLMIHNPMPRLREDNSMITQSTQTLRIHSPHSYRLHSIAFDRKHFLTNFSEIHELRYPIPLFVFLRTDVKKLDERSASESPGMKAYLLHCKYKLLRAFVDALTLEYQLAYPLQREGGSIAISGLS